MNFNLLPGLAILVVAALAVFLYWSDKGLKVTRYTVEHPSVPDAFEGFVIVQVSDLQSASFGRGQRRLAKAVSGRRRI